MSDEGAAQLVAVGTVIREAREAASLSLRVVAVRLGRSHGWLSGIEAGRRALYTQDLPGLARALDLDPSELFSRIRKKLDAIS